MIKFPLQFEVEALGKPGIQSFWTAKSHNLPEITCAIPPEFMGPGGAYSPEDLFGLSVLTCLIAVFKVYCEKAKASFDAVKGKATLTVDKHPSENYFGITKIDITLNVTGASDQEKVRKLLEAAVKDCLISNSIKSGKTFHLNVS